MLAVHALDQPAQQVIPLAVALREKHVAVHHIASPVKDLGRDNGGAEALDERLWLALGRPLAVFPLAHIGWIPQHAEHPPVRPDALGLFTGAFATLAQEDPVLLVACRHTEAIQPIGDLGGAQPLLDRPLEDEPDPLGLFFLNLQLLGVRVEAIAVGDDAAGVLTLGDGTPEAILGALEDFLALFGRHGAFDLKQEVVPNQAPPFLGIPALRTEILKVPQEEEHLKQVATKTVDIEDIDATYPSRIDSSQRLTKAGPLTQATRLRHEPDGLILNGKALFAGERTDRLKLLFGACAFKLLSRRDADDRSRPVHDRLLLSCRLLVS